MEVSTINGLTNYNSTTQAKDGGTLGQQEFLQLLVTQLQNQDPMNPQDGAEFASQLAQFNSVEQLIQVNSGLSDLAYSQDLMNASIANSMAASLTGKDVRAMSDQIHLSSDGNAEVNFELFNSAQEVEITIKTAGGAEVRTVTLENYPDGDNTWKWDGLDDNGERMGEGTYTIEITAKNGDDRVGVLSFLEGFAEKVRYSSDGVYLVVNGIEVPIGDVEEVGASTTEE